MSKLRTNQIETLDGLNTKDVATLVDDIDTVQVTTATGTQVLSGTLDRRIIYVDTIVDMEALDTSLFVDNQQVLVKGYSTGMDSGGGLFYWDSGATEAENGFDVFGSASSGRFIRLPVSHYNADMAGIVDDPALDQTTKYSTFLNRVPEGSTVDMLGYQILLKSNVTINSSFEMVNSGEVITDFILNFSGSYSLEGSLTAAASEGDNTVTYDGGDIPPGSLIAIHNDVDFSLNDFRAEYHDGEYAVVDSVSSGVIRLAAPLLSSYPSGTTSKVFLISATSPSISDLTVRNEEAVSPASALLDFTNCRDFLLNNVTASGGEARALGIVQSYGAELVNCSGINKTSPATGTNYGASIVNSQNVNVNGGNYWGTRHGTATGGTGGDLAIPCRFINFIKCNIGSSDSHGADFHGNTIDSYYDDCVIYNGSGIGGKNVGIRGGAVKRGPSSTEFVLNITEHYGGKLVHEKVTVDLLGGDSGISGFASTANADLTSESTSFSYRDIFVINNANQTEAPFRAYNNAGGLSVFRSYDYSNISFEEALDSITSDRLISLVGGATHNPLRRLSIRGVAPDSLTNWFIGSGDVVTAATFTEVPVAGTGTV